MKKRIFKVLCLAMASLVVLLSGCSAKTASKTVTENMSSSSTRKLTVYTSFYAMYDFAKKIGGDKINLTNLVPAGTEPHEWEPSTGDIKNLENADVLIYNGASMENWVDKVVKSLNNKKLITVEASKGINLSENKDKDEDLKYDPHVWLNPMNAKKELEAIKYAFVKADPKNKDYYEKNYADNAKKFDELDAEYRASAATFKSKNIVVAHQAFGYLCGAYGLKQIAIEGLNADSEPSPAKMAEISDFVKKNKIKYIFFEDLISPKVADTIAKETGAKTAVLNPLEGLEQKDIDSGKEYISVMKENLQTLKTALQ